MKSDPWFSPSAHTPLLYKDAESQRWSGLVALLTASCTTCKQSLEATSSCHTGTQNHVGGTASICSMVPKCAIGCSGLQASQHLHLHRCVPPCWADFPGDGAHARGPLPLPEERHRRLLPMVQKVLRHCPPAGSGLSLQSLRMGGFRVLGWGKQSLTGR